MAQQEGVPSLTTGISSDSVTKLEGYGEPTLEPDPMSRRYMWLGIVLFLLIVLSVGAAILIPKFT